MNRFLKTAVCFSLLLPCVACATPVTVKVKVVDEQQQPVINASVPMAFLLGKGVNSRSGTTNKDGVVEITENADFGVKISVLKEGYYRSSLRTGYGDQDLNLLLREKRSPIALYAKKVLISARESRKSGEQFGYDFMVGDFVSPHGKGKVNDLLVTHTYHKKDSWNYSYEISIKFSNPYDGLIPFFIEDKIKVSEFKSDYRAPMGGYINEWVLHGKREGAGKPVLDNKDKNRNYYFRVRTQADKDGNVESAYYGKIYGEFLSIAHYLNPTSNDRNVEFDPKQNLFKNLKHAEKVWAP